jgi:hypothetical protein
LTERDWTWCLSRSGVQGNQGGPPRRSWYNILSTLGIPHQHETFGRRNLVEQVFRSFKHRFSGMDKHFPWNANERSILRIRAFVISYNLLQSGE